MCSFTSQSFSKSEPKLSNYESYKLKHKTFKNTKYRFNSIIFDSRFISDNKIFENNEYLTNNHTNSNLDFKKLEENTDKDFFKNVNWDLKESSSVKKENSNWNSIEDSKKIQNNSKKDLKQENIHNNDNLKPIQNAIESERQLNIISNLDRTPPSGEISVGEFLIAPRGFLNLKGPEITLNIVDSDALETLKFLAKSGDFGFLYIDNQSSEDEGNSIPKITASFTKQKYSKRK